MHAASPSRIEAAFTGLVRHGRWLGRLPLLPWFADALFQTAVAIADPGRLRAMRAVERAAAAWPGVEFGWHRHGGVSCLADGREFAHLHGCGLLDVWLGRDIALKCIAEGRADPHHVFGESGWVSVWVRDAGAVAGAVELLRIAMERRPPPQPSP